MIRVNLLGKKTKFKLPKVLGIELANVSMIGWIVALVIFFVPEMFVVPFFEGEVVVIQTELGKVAGEANQLKDEIRRERQTQDEIEKFEQRIELLKKRGEQAQEVINRRTNPMNLLLHIARNIPDDLWIDSIIIQNKDIEIKGGAAQYASIGSFKDGANASIYFNQSLTLPDFSTKEVMGIGNKSVREEIFTIKGTINRYE